MGLNDRTGRTSVKMFSHVRVTNPAHRYYGSTGTVVRIDIVRRKVWIALPNGRVTGARNLSVEVVASKATDVLKSK